LEAALKGGDPRERDGKVTRRRAGRVTNIYIGKKQCRGEGVIREWRLNYIKQRMRKALRLAGSQFSLS